MSPTVAGYQRVLVGGMHVRNKGFHSRPYLGKPTGFQKPLIALIIRPLIGEFFFSPEWIEIHP